MSNQPVIAVAPNPAPTASAPVAPANPAPTIVAASIGLIISIVLLYVFYRVMQSLLRLKKVSKSLQGVDKAQLLAMVGDQEAADALQTGADNLWINITLIGIFIVYGISAVIGVGASIVGFYDAVTAK